MEFKYYIKLKNRMTKINDKIGNCGISCEDCPFERDNNGYGMYCAEFEALYPEVAEAIVEKWAEENLVKSRQQALLEVFPNYDITKLPYPCMVDKMLHCEIDFGSTMCKQCIKDYWSGKYEEPKKGE